MVLQAFQIRLVITSKKAISGNIGRFYEVFCGADKQPIISFHRIYAHHSCDVRSAIASSSIQSISCKLCAQSNCSSIKSKNYFSDIFSCRIALTMRRRLYFDDREMKWISEIKWIWKIK